MTRQAAPSEAGPRSAGAPRISTLAWCLGGALLALLILWGYRGVFASYFMRDDFMWLHDARRQLEDPLLFFTWRPSDYFRPVSNLWFGGLHLLFGLRPQGYFCANLLLHLWNTLWLAALVHAVWRERVAAGTAALVAAVLICSGSSIVWISGLVSLLATACMLPALYLHLAYLRGGGRLPYAGSILCMALAVSTRESGVLVAPLMLALEWSERGWRSLFTRSAVKRYLPHAALALAYVWIQWDFLSGASDPQSAPGVRASASREHGPPLLSYLLNSVSNLPVLLHWSSGRARVAADLATGLWMLAGAGLLLGLLRGRRGLREFAALALLLPIVLAPNYTLLSLSSELAPRYRYEAGLWASLLVGLCCAGLWRRAGGAAWARLLALCPLLAFAGVHLRALPDFVDDNPRYGRYSRWSRQLVEGLERELPALMARDPGGPVRLALVGAPVENPRHLSSLLSVWFDAPEDCVSELPLELEEPVLRGKLERLGAAHLAELAGTQQLHLWDMDSGLSPRLEGPVPFIPLLKLLQRNWRAPRAPSKRGRILVIELPARGATSVGGG